MTAVTAAPPKSPPPSSTPPGELRRIPLVNLYESPRNPRQHYDEQALAELAASLLQTGQLTPVIVRPRKAGGYELAAGHRRFRAAKLAVQQQPDGAKYRGLDALEAKVVALDERAFIEVLNIENLQRDDLHPLEEAAGFRDLMTGAGYDVAKIAARIGRSPRYVYDSLTLLKLIPRAKTLFLDDVFERGHAIELARLAPDQQERALGDLEEVVGAGEYGARRESLLLRPDHAAEEELPLHDQVKPVSVREFKQAIQERIRATPDRVDPFLFPDSARALEAAKEEKLSVIHITREWRPADEVRDADQKERVFGSQAWERADGKVEEDYHTGRPVKSKPCDWSRYGFVACGPGQGEVFKVCINKQKCTVHWPEHVKRAEAAKKRAKSGKSASTTGGAEKHNNTEAAEARERAAAEQRKAQLEQERGRLITERAPQWALAVNALAKQIKLPDPIAVYIGSDVLNRAFDDVTDRYGNDATQHVAEIFAAMRKQLPGKWSTSSYSDAPEPRDAKAAVVGIALLYWFANCTKKLDAELEAAAVKAVNAAEDAAAKKAVKKPATKKAKKAKKAKRGR